MGWPDLGEIPRSVNPLIRLATSWNIQSLLVASVIVLTTLIPIEAARPDNHWITEADSALTWGASSDAQLRELYTKSASSDESSQSAKAPAHNRTSPPKIRLLSEDAKFIAVSSLGAFGVLVAIMSLIGRRKDAALFYDTYPWPSTLDETTRAGRLAKSILQRASARFFIIYVTVALFFSNLT